MVEFRMLKHAVKNKRRFTPAQYLMYMFNLRERGDGVVIFLGIAEPE